jgi:L-arabinokinase
MEAAHQSYGACGLGSAATDRLVEMVKEAGASAGVYGAKITGGGAGGTVCILAWGEQGRLTVDRIHQRYQKETGQSLICFSDSSPGAYFT